MTTSFQSLPAIAAGSSACLNLDRDRLRAGVAIFVEASRARP